MQGVAEDLIDNMPCFLAVSRLRPVAADRPLHLGLHKVEAHKVPTLFLAFILHTCALTARWTVFGQTAFPEWLELWKESLAQHTGAPSSGGMSAQDGVEAKLPNGTGIYLEMVGESPFGQSPPGTSCLHVLDVCLSRLQQ